MLIICLYAAAPTRVSPLCCAAFFIHLKPQAPLVKYLSAGTLCYSLNCSNVPIADAGPVCSSCAVHLPMADDSLRNALSPHFWRTHHRRHASGVYTHMWVWVWVWLGGWVSFCVRVYGAPGVHIYMCMSVRLCVCVCYVLQKRA